MYFVRNNSDAMTDAYFAYSHQFLPPPHSSGGIVGITQEHHFHFRICGLLLQILEIHRIGIVCKEQWR